MDLRSKDAIESSKQHDIKIGNILIAEFMGVKTITIDKLKSILKQNREDGFISTPQAYTLDELKYDTSWDWLMPVANEIIKSRDEQNADWDLTDLKYALQTTNIELVYKAVVEFIKNQNN
jgi:hypothetical protein